VEDLGATFFEATTALAFDEFARQRVDVAVVETGLGGRLDATNVVEPVAAIVTGIAMDHMEYLGNNISEIAAEKAGIFKPGSPAIIGERNADIARLLAGHALAAGVSRVVSVADSYAVTGVVTDAAGTRFALDTPNESLNVELQLRGVHQVSNACTAIAALDAAGEKYRPRKEVLERSLRDAFLAGRLQLRDKYVFDVAHNPDGIRALVEALGAILPDGKRVALFCALSDKDWRAMILALAPAVSLIVLTNAPTAPESRRWNLASVQEEASRAGVTSLAVSDFDAAMAEANRRGDFVIVTGSFHTVGDAMIRLQVSPFSP
jgi:dihydrofolate synthase/folylpolyglutamate synthase